MGASSNTQDLHLLFDRRAAFSFPFSGISPETVPKDSYLKRAGGLAESGGEGQWKIIGEGRKWLESGGGKETRKKDEGKETVETILHNLTFSDPLGRIFEGQLYQLLQLSL